jgi:hypothetical protein
VSYDAFHHVPRDVLCVLGIVSSLAAVPDVHLPNYEMTAMLVRLPAREEMMVSVRTALVTALHPFGVYSSSGVIFVSTTPPIGEIRS